MRIEEFAEQFKQKTGRYKDWSDVEIVRLVKEKKPALLNKIDKYDLEDALKTTQAQRISQQRQKTFKTLSGISRFGIGVEHGIADTFMGVMQLFSGSGKLSGTGYSLPGQESVPHEGYERYKQEYKEASEGDKAAGAGEIAGSLVATAPIPGATGAKLAGKITGPLVKDGVKVAVPLGKRLLASGVKAGTAAGIGAGYGAGEYVDEDETRLRNTVYGALFGAGGLYASKLLGKVGGKVYNTYKNKMKNAPLQDLMALEKKHNLQLSLGDITESPTLSKFETLSENVPGLGTTGLRETGSKSLKESSKALKQKFALPEGADVGRTIKESVKKGKQKVSKQATKNYNEVEKLSGGAKTEAKNSVKKLDKILKKDFAGDLPTDEGTVKWFQGLRDNIASGKKNFKSLRTTREQLGKEAQKYKVNDPNRTRLLMEVREEVEKDMDEAIMSQVKSMSMRKGKAEAKKIYERRGFTSQDEAKVKETMLQESEKQIAKGKALKEAYETAKTHYKSEVVPFKERDIRKVGEEIDPDKIYKRFIKANNKDMAVRFHKALDADGKKAIKAQMVSDAVDGATDKKGYFSPAKFTTYWDKMEAPKSVFFKGADAREIEGYQKLLLHADRFGQFAENPPTGNRVAQMLGAFSYTTVGIPLSAFVVRLMSTKAGKRLLLSSSKFEPGSEKMQKVIELYKKNISKASAVTGKEIGE